MFLSLRSVFVLALTGTTVMLAQTAQTTADPVPVTHSAFPTGTTLPLGAQVAVVLADPKVARAHWGIAVTEMDGTPIYGFDEGKFFRPASNAKLFTTATAMALLGADTRVKTEAQGSQPISEAGVLRGDLTLKGAGDANLSDRTIPYESPAERRRKAAAAKEQGRDGSAGMPSAQGLSKIDALAADLARRGLKRVTGNILGDDSLWPWEPYANDWTIDDAVWGYGAPVSALTITDNQLDLTVSPGAHPGEPATIQLQPDLGYYRVEAQVTTVPAKQPANVQVERAIGSRVLRVYGSIAMNAPDHEEVAIEDPAEFAALALKKALEAHGVEVDGGSRAIHRPDTEPRGFGSQVREPLLSFQSPVAAEKAACSVCPLSVEVVSPALAEDVTVTMKVSQNLHAEMLLRRLGKAFGEDGTSAQGARVVRQFLLNAGLDGDDFVFYDGSGLSAHDVVTPRAAAQLLAFAAKQPWFAPWKAALPVGGEDGTLVSRFPNAPLKDHLFAKTGTLSETRALSGYLDCASGKTVIFSVIVDNHTPVTSDDRVAMDKIVAAIAANE